MNWKQMILWVIVLFVIYTIIIFPFVFAYGVRTGNRQAEDWETTKIHRTLQLNGYNYCPWCGAEMSEIPIGSNVIKSQESEE